jgi:hypothetical protein
MKRAPFHGVRLQQNVKRTVLVIEPQGPVLPSNSCATLAIGFLFLVRGPADSQIFPRVIVSLTKELTPILRRY